MRLRRHGHYKGALAYAGVCWRMLSHVGRPADMRLRRHGRYRRLRGVVTVTLMRYATVVLL
jgi:hypothetical protein